ncbi:MAG: hypothetical protein IPQ07_03160 [Myxococcales bacterium]|nr:hypothetical protein [Myxococcales bacterium]
MEHEIDLGAGRRSQCQLAGRIAAQSDARGLGGRQDPQAGPRRQLGERRRDLGRLVHAAVGARHQPPRRPGARHHGDRGARQLDPLREPAVDHDLTLGPHRQDRRSEGTGTLEIARQGDDRRLVGERAERGLELGLGRAHAAEREHEVRLRELRAQPPEGRDRHRRGAPGIGDRGNRDVARAVVVEGVAGELPRADRLGQELGTIGRQAAPRRAQLGRGCERSREGGAHTLADRNGAGAAAAPSGDGDEGEQDERGLRSAGGHGACATVPPASFHTAWIFGGK